MNTIYRVGKMKMSVYADHAPVHFHVRTREPQAMGVSFAIDLTPKLERLQTRGTP